MIPVLIATFLISGTTPPEPEQPYGMRIIFFNAGLPMPTLPESLQKPQPIHERDGEQLTIGTARYKGDVRFRTIPDEKNAKIQILLSATGWTELTTYRGNLVVGSQYSTRVEAESPLTILADRVTHGPLHATVCARTESIHVEPCRRRLFSPIVSRLAARMLEGRRDELAQKIARKTVKKFRRGLDQHFATLSEKISDQVTDNMLKFKSVDLNPRLCSSSTAEHAEIHVCMDGLTAWKPPPFPEVRRGLQIALNEEAITLYSEVLRGKNTHVAKVENILKSWVHNPKPFNGNGEAIDSVQLAKRKPITMRFSNGFIHFNMRADKVVRGKQILDGIKVEAKFQPKLEKRVVRFVRIGDVKISLLNPPPKGKMTLQQFTRLEMMRRSIPKMLPSELVLSAKRLAPNGAVTRVECDNGWLTIQMEATEAE